jgi:hypothetical protein
MFTPGASLVVGNPSIGNQTQAMSSSAAKLTAFNDNTTNGQALAIDDGASVVPDLANNRLKLNTPGTYFVTASLSVTCSGSADLTVQVGVNGAVQPNLSAKAGVSTSARTNLGITGFVKVDRSMVSSGLTFQTVLELFGLVSTGTPNLTVEYAHFAAQRVG